MGHWGPGPLQDLEATTEAALNVTGMRTDKTITIARARSTAVAIEVARVMGT